MKPKKKLGQNFLVDNNVLQKITSAVNATKSDIILEIGPGQGTMTKELVKMAPVVAIELDKELSIYLDSIKEANIIYEDILNINIETILEEYTYKEAFIVANIPYYITTPIIKKIINSKILFKEIILMVQSEMANRLSSLPGESDYGSLTVILNYHFNIEKLFTVNKKSFYPIPKVDSAVIKLKSKEQKLPLKNYDFFEKFVKECFLHRRKTLKNNLLKYNLDEINSILQKHHVSVQNRPQELSLEAYVDLANFLSNK